MRRRAAKADAAEEAEEVASEEGVAETAAAPGTALEAKPGIGASIAASIWLGLFAYKHVEYSSQLWWEFELHGDASRFLRATVGVAIGLVLLTLTRLFRHAPHELKNQQTRNSRRPQRSSRDRSHLRRSWSTCATKASSSMTKNVRSSCTEFRAARGRRWRRSSTRAARVVDPLVHRTLRRLRRSAGLLPVSEGAALSLRRFWAQRSSSSASAVQSIVSQLVLESQRAPATVRR